MRDADSFRHGEFEIRRARDEDSDAVIAIIDAVYREYPGCILDVDNEEPELRTPASSFDEFWVAERRGAIVGSSALQIFEDGVGELKKVFLHRDTRGHGLGGRLVRLIEERAKASGCGELFLWTDTRFELAHAVYTKLGYTKTGEERTLHDLSNTSEFRFEKRLTLD